MRSRLDIVGRAGELSVLEQLLDATRAGSARAGIIEGEAGIGKSRLIDEICGRAIARGFGVWRATGEEFQSGRPFSVMFAALLRQLAREEDRARIAELSEEIPAAFGTDHRYRIIEAIEDALEHESSTRSVLVCVDDAHWADSSSLLALRALARRMDLPVAVLVTCRPTPRPPDLSQLLDALISYGSAHLHLAPLDESAVVELARGRLHATPGETLRHQLRGAGGNPFFVLELLDSLAHEKMIELDGTRAETPKLLQPSPSLRALILRRLSFMGEETLKVLRTAAILGDSFSAQDLAVVGEMPLVDVLNSVREPIVTGVLDADGETFSFQHDVVREALYSDVAPALRRGLHLHVGRTLAAAGASPVRVAHHVGLGADVGDREAVGWIRDAAVDVGPRDPELAVDLLGRAAALLHPDDPERDGLLLEKVMRLIFAGSLRRAAQAADELRRRVAGTPVAPMVDLQRLAILSLQFRTAEMASLADALLDEGVQDEDLRMQMVVASAAARMAGGDVRGALSRMEEAREFTKANPDSAASGLYLWLEAGPLIHQGRFTTALRKFEQALPRTEMFIGGRGQGLGVLGHAYCIAADEFEKSRATLEEARAELEHRGALSYVVEYHWFRAHLEFTTGRWDDALAEVAAARALAAETNAFGVAMAASPDPTILIALFRGDVRAAQQALATTGLSPSGMWVTHWLEPIRALVQDAAGDRIGALSRLRQWQDELAANKNVPDFRTVGRSFIRLYRDAACDDLLEQALMSARLAHERAAGLKSMEAAALLAQGLIEDDSDRLLAAVEAARIAGRPFDLAETCAEASTGLLRRGDTEAGRRLGLEAWTLYEELGAGRQEATLARELRDLGIRRGSREKRGRPTQGWDSLTESERRVIALVAEGLTNGEIGQRLFVSRGTVATHLRSIFRKLDVSSRAELAAASSRRVG